MRNLGLLKGQETKVNPISIHTLQPRCEKHLVWAGPPSKVFLKVPRQGWLFSCCVNWGSCWKRRSGRRRGGVPPCGSWQPTWVPVSRIVSALWRRCQQPGLGRTSPSSRRSGSTPAGPALEAPENHKEDSESGRNCTGNIKIRIKKHKATHTRVRLSVL